MATPKSLYDRIVEELQAEQKIRVFTEEQNIKTMEELNGGDMEDFLFDQKNKEKESELELAGIILNA